MQERFLALSNDQKRIVHIALCRHSLDAWSAYCDQNPKLWYMETVAGTRQDVDNTLPQRALSAVESNTLAPSIAADYLEPMTALQDMDWEPPEHVAYAYYSIYNLYCRYSAGEEIDDWLIVNQALSSFEDIAHVGETLENALARVT